MNIRRLDHLVLTVKDLAATIHFYTEALGMKVVTFGEGRKALAFGEQKINLHVAGTEIKPHAAHPQSGSADLCFVVSESLDEIIAHLAVHKIPILEGPVERTGALGKISSVYLRDPDQNLIELSQYPDGH